MPWKRKVPRQFQLCRSFAEKIEKFSLSIACKRERLPEK